MDPLCPSDISPSSPCGGLRGDKSVLLPLALPQGRGGRTIWMANLQSSIPSSGLNLVFEQGE